MQIYANCFFSVLCIWVCQSVWPHSFMFTNQCDQTALWLQPVWSHSFVITTNMIMSTNHCNPHCVCRLTYSQIDNDMYQCMRSLDPMITQLCAPSGGRDRTRSQRAQSSSPPAAFSLSSVVDSPRCHVPLALTCSLAVRCRPQRWSYSQSGRLAPCRSWGSWHGGSDKPMWSWWETQGGPCIPSTSWSAL